MKKKMVFLWVLTALIGFSVSSQAQDQEQERPRGGRGGGGFRGQMQAEQKQKLKDDLKLSDVQADSVVAINKSFAAKQRELFMNQDLSREEKRTQLTQIEDQKKQLWGKALKDTALASKVADYFKQQQRNRMMQRNQQ